MHKNDKKIKNDFKKSKGWRAVHENQVEQRPLISTRGRYVIRQPGFKS